MHAEEHCIKQHIYDSAYVDMSAQFLFAGGSDISARPWGSWFGGHVGRCPYSLRATLPSPLFCSA
jgi:hypothetical protein